MFSKVVEVPKTDSICRSECRFTLLSNDGGGVSETGTIAQDTSIAPETPNTRSETNMLPTNAVPVLAVSRRSSRSSNLSAREPPDAIQRSSLRP
jgi:hypothetical protein